MYLYKRRCRHPCKVILILGEEESHVINRFEQNVQKEMKTTIARRKANNDGLKNDEKGGGKGKYKKQNKKGADDKGKEQEKKLNPVEGGLFDIKI